MFPALLLLYFVPYGIDSWFEKKREKSYQDYLEKASQWAAEVNGNDVESVNGDIG